MFWRTFVFNSDIQGVWKRALLIPLILQDSKVKLAKKNKEGKKEVKISPQIFILFLLLIKTFKESKQTFIFQGSTCKIGKMRSQISTFLQDFSLGFVYWMWELQAYKKSILNWKMAMATPDGSLALIGTWHKS